MKTQYKATLKDIILTAVYLGLIIINILNYFCKNGFENIGTVIEETLLIMLAFVTLVDIASYANWSIFVPDFFEFFKEKKHLKDVHAYIETYIKEDINFLQDYSNERISFIMSQLGITKSQLDEIRLELIKMRCIPLKSLDDAKEKIKSLATSGYPIIIDQDKIDSSKICYTKVQYYINTMDIMFMPDYANELSSILVFLIKEKIKDISKIDKLIIPHDSNFLLGVEVGKKLGKSVVKMRYRQGKIETEKIWDGNLNITDRVIIIHDVLVSGEQIIDTINKLPESCTILGFFCLIVRKEWNGKKTLAKKSFSCYEVIEIDDEDIRNLRR
jgi:adenine/guanine phosphoribosyltransferase-like PRPP-binding protein